MGAHELADLKRALYSLFSQFGAVLDIVALKTSKMRGQAFVVFRVWVVSIVTSGLTGTQDIASATHALRSLQGFPFFDRELVCLSSPLSHASRPAANLICQRQVTLCCQGRWHDEQEGCTEEAFDLALAPAIAHGPTAALLKAKPATATATAPTVTATASASTIQSFETSSGPCYMVEMVWLTCRRAAQPHSVCGQPARGHHGGNGAHDVQPVCRTQGGVCSV